MRSPCTIWTFVAPGLLGALGFLGASCVDDPPLLGTDAGAPDALVADAAPLRAPEDIIGCQPLELAPAEGTSTDGFAFVRYSGKVPSFDGTPLDVTLTVPAGQLTPRPLLVMVHGWGGSKADWHAQATTDSDGYEDLGFASRGWAVLTYTARGFRDSCGHNGHAGASCADGHIHLFDRRWEIRDLRHLAGVMADACAADPQRVGVTGISYGGGHALLMAVEGDVVTVMSPDDPESVTLEPWRSPAGRPMHLAASVPIIPPSDLIQSLQPNGRASDGVILPDGDRLLPVGVQKQSWVAALYGLGAATGRYAEPTTDPTADMTTWYAQTSAGEPYDTAQLAQLVTQLTRWRSAYYQDDLIARAVATKNQVPTLFLQGWTDELFPWVEAAAMIRKVKQAAPSWPITASVGDIGHFIGQNKADEWASMRARAFGWLDHYVRGVGNRPSESIQVRVTTCDDTTGASYAAPSIQTLALRRQVFASTTAATTASAPTDPSGGAETDPVAHSRVGGCIQTGPASASSAVWTWDVEQDFTLLGMPVVEATVSVDGTDAVIAPRLWDTNADGTERILVTRGAYRHQGSGGDATVATALEGNAWVFKKGRRLQLEITQNDAPHVRLNNLPSSIRYTSVKLTLPRR